MNESFQRTYFDDIEERCRRPNSMVPRPFLRWAGSKRTVLRHFLDALPRKFRVYREPFLGSAALFFLLEPDRAVLSDACNDLIETFLAVRDDVSSVSRYLRPMRPSKKEFYRIRSNPSKGRIKHAAEFIYLNKTCWNGLYRVNSEGTFNVPFGLPKTNCTAPPNLGQVVSCF